MIPRESHAQHPRPRPPSPVPSAALDHLRLSIENAIHLRPARTTVSVYRALDAASKGQNVNPAVLMHSVVPSTHHHVITDIKHDVYGARFVGLHGDRFVTSSRDKALRVFQTSSSHHPTAWRKTHSIRAHAVRWTITDFDVSPDGRWLAYASINSLVHLVDLDNPYDLQHVLDFSAGHYAGVNIWSLKWGHDGRELIVGTGANTIQANGLIIAYDVETRRVLESIPAHDADVNSVAFLQTGDCNMLLSAADDAIVKMWDRRNHSRSRRHGNQYQCPHRAAASFVGHRFGLTYVSPKDDGRFFISNGKDQLIKLWDARRSTPDSQLDSARQLHRSVAFDYRIHSCPRFTQLPSDIRDDAVMSYAGAHETLKTLIRAHFSPMHTTGQRYIYCGSSDGLCVVYDVLTGKVVRTLRGHDGPVRDVSWHPYASFLTTGSFDGRVSLWTTHREREKESDAFEETEGYIVENAAYVV